MPMMAGVPNSAMVSRKTRTMLARIVGQTSGSVIRSVVRQVPAPRMFAASSISEATRSSADLRKTKMKGKECSAMTTARPKKV